MTSLRGWVAAGRPRHGLTPWGSFEGWSGVVREAVVFASLPDPGETREQLQTSADRDAAAVSMLIAAIEQADPYRRGLTTAAMVEAARPRRHGEPAAETWAEDLRAGIEDLCGRLDSKFLGYKLRHFKRRNFGGRMLDTAGEDKNHGNRWAVVPVSPRTRGTVPARGPVGGDDGDAGDVLIDAAAPDHGEEVL